MGQTGARGGGGLVGEGGTWQRGVVGNVVVAGAACARVVVAGQSTGERAWQVTGKMGASTAEAGAESSWVVDSVVERLVPWQKEKTEEEEAVQLLLCYVAAFASRQVTCAFSFASLQWVAGVAALGCLESAC